MTHYGSCKKIKPVRICDIILIILICAVAATLILNNITNSENALTALIYKDNKLVQRVDLSMLTEPKEIKIDGDICVTVLLESDGATVIHSDCSDRLCEKQGKLTYAGAAAVCLPAGVAVELEGSSEIDAVVR